MRFGPTVDHAQATIEAAPQMDEANTKAALLRDFLDLLDWTIPDNTQLEYSVKAFGLAHRIRDRSIRCGLPHSVPWIDPESSSKQRADPGKRLYTAVDVGNILLNGQANAGLRPAFAILVPTVP